MIIGNPYKLSIEVQMIKEWNNKNLTFCNGVLIICIDGNLFPKEIVTATLSREVLFLKRKLKNIAIDNELYEMEKYLAFKKIYDITYPNDWNIDNDYKYDITPDSLQDCGCYVFAVGNGKNVRVMASQLKYIVDESKHEFNNNISETIISMKELDDIILNLDIY